MNTYHIWAEHTDGASVGHPCRKGIYSDPTDQFSETVDAENEDAAREIGQKRLQAIVDEAETCQCERHLAPGWDSWWNSVTIIASRTPYPKYVGDAADDE